jgi:hypothetical protein
MSNIPKEVEIYNKWFPNTDYSQANILNAIKEALSQPSSWEQGEDAILFAEWKDNNTIIKEKNIFLVNGKPRQFFEMNEQLYSYEQLYSLFKQQSLK